MSLLTAAKRPWVKPVPDPQPTGGHGVNTAAVNGMSALAADACVPLTELITDATTRFDVGQQRLYLTVPQAFMGNRARLYSARNVG